MKFAAQVAGLQAASVTRRPSIPSSEADSSLLLVIAELFAGLLFFAAGFDRQVLAILAGHAQDAAAGTGGASPRRAAGHRAARAARLFVYGLRLAFPVIAFLVLVDLTLGFLGRVNAQLQLLTLAFPVKIMAALGLFAVLTPVYARVYQPFAQHTLETAGRILLRR